VDTPTISRGNGRGKVQILTRQNLDGRTKARKQFDAIASGIASDLGGPDRLSTVQRHLVEAFAGVAMMVNTTNARLLLGEEVDIVEHAQVVSTLTRVASRIGLGRIPRDVTPSLAAYVAQAHEAQNEADVEVEMS
jgi:hypothetical protein